MKGKGKFVVNGKDVEEYFGRVLLMNDVKKPLEVTKTEGEFDIAVKVTGGGETGQAQAIRHGLAKALTEANPELRGELKRRGLLTRDPRMKERKKYGQRGARARFQFSKR